MPVADVLDYVFSGVKIAIAGIELKVFLYLISGGWIDVLRIISFFLDSLLVKYIGIFFVYFSKIISGTIFSEKMITGVMNRLYVFIGIFVFFKLSMLLIKYISTPELVSDSKIGVNSLIKRVIFGFGLILLTPFIFRTAMNLQKAILDDQIIEKVLLSQEDYLIAVANKDRVGNLIGMNILQGFWSPNNSEKSNSKSVRNYNKAVDEADPSVVGWPSINSGRVLGLGEYDYNYFPILSTVALGYTLYIAVKFCIDVALRGFKLGFLQMMAPIAIVDYMVYGKDDGTFKNWLKLCKGTYLMLFVRVISLWFVVFVTTLMQKKGTDSLLYQPKNGQVDYLLRAIIIIALLAFMMELPKLLSEVFGLDLEGDATVKGLMKSVTGGIKTVAGAGLAMGGAAIGGAFGAAQGLSKGLANNDPKQVLGALGGNAGGIMKAGLGQTKLGGTLVSSMSNGYNSNVKDADEGHAKTKQEKAKEEEATRYQEERNERQQAALNRQQNDLRDIAQYQMAKNPNIKKDELIGAMKDSVINAKLKLSFSDVNEMTKDIKGSVNANNSPKTLVQQVQQVLGNKLDIPVQQTELIVNQVLGNSTTVTPAQVDQVVNQVIEKAKDNAVPSITVAVNQVMGETVSLDSSTTVTVDQKQGKTVDTPNDTTTVTVDQQQGQTVDSTDNATRVVNEVNGSSIDDSPLTSSSKSNDNTGYNKNNNDNDIDTLL